MKIKLIAPHEQSEDTISSAQTFKIQKVNLPLLAALTSPGHTIKIVDEAFVADDISEEVDWVGITVMLREDLARMNHMMMFSVVLICRWWFLSRYIRRKK